MCKRTGKPFGYYGQSYFPDFVEGQKSRANIDLLNQAAFIYCRDGNTLAGLTQIAKDEARTIDAMTGVVGLSNQLQQASILEAITPLLIAINRKYKTKSSGIRITGI